MSQSSYERSSQNVDPFNVNANNPSKSQKKRKSKDNFERLKGDSMLELTVSVGAPYFFGLIRLT